MGRAIRFIVDIDETLLNPISAWRAYIKDNLRLDLSLGEIRVSGGVQRALAKRGISEGVIRGLDAFKYSASENSNLPAMPGAFRNLKAAINASSGKIEMYLTARPQVVSNVTYDNLRSYDAPNAKIVFLGSESQENASIEKKRIIQSNRREDSILIVIDDNVDLIADIVNFKDSRIYPICVLGPFSLYQLDVARRREILDYCHTWRTIPSLVTRRIEHDYWA